MPEPNDFHESEAQDFLTRFDHDPAAAMAEPCPRFDRVGRAIPGPRGALAMTGADLGEALLARDGVRKTLKMVVDGAVIALDNVLPGKAPIEDIDRPENLVDSLRHDRLEDMDRPELRSADLQDTPWSDDYWALYLGCLGKRYADPDFPASQDWEENYEYVHEHPVTEVLGRGAAAIDRLSPAEKYDLLIGGAGQALTRTMWAQGQWYHLHDGKVAPWMGICHGWAPASYALPRPRRKITLLAADGQTPLTFYPADIKALASLLWTNTQTVTRLIGSRCNEKSPETDAIGRVTSARAFNTNPGTWHLCVVNQIGVAGRAFVMDATYDLEVWNQPVCGYSYRYFNPATLRLTRSLSAATVARDKFPRDRFARYRSERAAAIAGIVMNVRYVAEAPPEQRATDDPEQDRIIEVQYKYDLELDPEGRILGGEWYTGKQHPDFLWTPPKGTRAITPQEQLATGAWSGEGALPASWRKAAAQAASRGMPLAKIVERMLLSSCG
jgi:hypothetical protein